MTPAGSSNVVRSVRRGVPAALGLALLLAACTVGPNYTRPPSSIPEKFIEQPPGRRIASRAYDEAWWKTFHDTTLDALIASALANAPDLQIARARVLEARAEGAAVSGELLPQVSADGAYARQHGSQNVPTGTPPGGLGPGVGSNLWLAGFDASWELDLFGGTRRAIESADASVAAQVADREESELVLAAEVARNYIVFRTEQRQLSIALDTLNLRRDTLRLTMAQFDSGLAAALDPIRARAEVADSEAEVPLLEVDMRSSMYRLGVLVGRNPESLGAELNNPRAIPEAHDDVPVGLPSDLLRRRPDIRAAERRLAAANARIGVREADLYPHLSLTGVGGFESLEAASLVTAPSHYFAIGPSISWSVFDANRIRDDVLAERARRDVAAAQYQKSILTALADVETALVAYGKSEVRRNALQREVQASQAAVEQAQRLYASGLENFLTVLEAERSLQGSRMSLALAEGNRANSYVSLVKALGGQWDTEPPPKP